MGDQPGKRASAPAHHVLPVVQTMCAEIDKIFVRYVGPIAPEITDEVYLDWVGQGNTGPTGVLRYIHMLSRNILEESQRVPFFEEARRCVRVGPASGT